MNRVIVLIALVSFVGCAPTHTLKEVVHHPGLLVETDNPQESPLAAADQWVRKNLW